MSNTDRPPLTGFSRAISLAAIILAVFAATVFIVVLVLGSGDSDGGVSSNAESNGGVSASVAEAFGPIAIGATALALIAAVIAVTRPRARVLGVTSLLVLLPCVVLSLLTLVALSS